MEWVERLNSAINYMEENMGEDVKEIEPLEFEHQGNLDDWLIIDKIEDVVVGTSIPYNYDKSKF